MQLDELIARDVPRDIHQDNIDEAQLKAWIEQTAAIPGWGKS